MIDTSKDEINNKEITLLQPSKLVEGKQVACVLVAQIVSPTKRLYIIRHHHSPDEREVLPGELMEGRLERRRGGLSLQRS